MKDKRQQDPSLDDLLKDCDQEKMRLEQEDEDWINRPPVGKEVEDE